MRRSLLGLLALGLVTSVAAQQINHKDTAPLGAPLRLGADHWNKSFAVTGGVDGQVFLRSSGAADGWIWGTAGAPAGGTGFGSYAVGDLLYASTASALAKLAAVADGNVLRSAGVGTAPLWGPVRLSGATVDVTGTLPVGSGGTGQPSYTIGDLLYADGTTSLARLADVATGSVLVSGGVGVAPAWSASPTLTLVLLGDGTVGAPAVAFANDSNTGFYLNGVDIGVSLAINGIEALRLNTTSISILSNTALFRLGASLDLIATRDAAGIWAQRNDANAQTLRVYGTFTDASNYERASLATVAGTGITLAVETAGTGADNLSLTLTPAGTGTVRVTGLTTGSVVFTGASGALLQDNANLFWDDASNLLGVGTAVPEAEVHIDQASSAGGGLIDYVAADANAARLAFRKSRGGGTPAVLSNDLLSTVVTSAHDGTAYSGTRARVAALANQNWSAGAHGTRMEFATTPNGSTTLTNRLTVGAAGAVTIGATEPATPLGGSLYFTGVTQGNLGTPSNGTVVFCTDCTKATPCAGGGNGALAKRINGAWDCD